MKKLSIVLALIMALSCFSITAFAADESTTAETTTAAPAKIVITVTVENIRINDGVEETYVLNYEMANGGTLTADDIIASVTKRLGDEYGYDANEYVVSPTVIAYDDVDLDGSVDDPYAFTKITVKGGETYNFDVLVTEIDDVKNLATTLGEQLAKLDWGGIAKANVALWNQIISGTKAAIESLVNAEWPCMKETTTEAEITTEVVEGTPETGVSAVAGAAVVVLALSATTAVVLRKKED